MVASEYRLYRLNRTCNAINLSNTERPKSPPYSDSGAANLSVSFGEIAWLFWGKFLNLGFGSNHRQLFLKSRPQKFIDQGPLPTQLRHSTLLRSGHFVRLHARVVTWQDVHAFVPGV
jgi:hypothetical protein